jgi:dihydrofolate reductase
MLALIWAQADGGVIGDRGRIPWRLPEDQAQFKRLTIGATVLMGRLTWESLPTSVRPLPGRRNLVLTSDVGWSSEGAERVESVDEAIATTETDLWVVGGERVYRASLPYADRLVVTEVDGKYDGDTFAPALDESWQVAGRDPADGWLTSADGLRYKVTVFERSAAIPSTP